MKLDDNTFAFTAWLMRNTHVVSVTGLSIDDGYEWYNYMWEKWLHNSDAGRKIINDWVRDNNMNNDNPDDMNTNNNTDNNNTMAMGEKNPHSAVLDTITFTFSQEANCVDGPSDDIETLTVEAKSSLGIDGDGGAFYVLRTEQWAIEGANEISELIKRCETAVNAIVGA
jgi:hypothetical protein